MERTTLIEKVENILENNEELAKRFVPEDIMIRYELRQAIRQMRNKFGDFFTAHSIRDEFKEIENNLKKELF